MRAWGAAVAALALGTSVLATAGGARAEANGCRIGLIGELKVLPGEGSPHLKGEVEGHPIDIVADSGASSTILIESTARRLRLPLDEARGVQFAGAGGMLRTYTTPLVNVKLGGVAARIPLLVTSGAVRVDMLLGDDFFNQADVEFDLAHDAIRLLNTRGCADDQMPYWAKGGYSIAPLIAPSEAIGHYITEVRINGRPVRAVIDSGADTSVLTAESARDLGVRVTAGQVKAQGLGGGALAVSTTELDTFSVGDETIRKTRLQVADLNRGVAFSGVGSRIGTRGDALGGMLLGADFLRSHRVILSRARNKAYFTYSGGPVFRIDERKPAPAETPASPPPPTSAPKPPG